MKVDMSPEAISGRLDRMGQLWELSVALSVSEFLDGSKRRPLRHRVAAMEDAIRKVLIDQWDPIGVSGVPEAIDEYDAYIGRIFSLVRGDRSSEEIAELLRKIEQEELGVGTSTESRKRVANKLKDLQSIFGKEFL